MNPKVLRIESASEGILILRFSNQELRQFDVRPYIDRGGVFNALATEATFAAARVVSGSVQWPGEVDLSYDTLYLRSMPVVGGREAA